MSEMNMRERIARALAGVMFQGGDYEDVPVEHVFVRPRYTHLAAAAYGAADAVLDVLREPTKAMLCAVDVDADDKMLARGRAYSAWVSMINAARTPTEEI